MEINISFGDEERFFRRSLYRKVKIGLKNLADTCLDTYLPF